MKEVLMKHRLTVLFSLLIATSAYAADQQQLIQESRLAIKSFAGQLKGELMAGLQKGGPLQAMTVCHDVAEDIAIDNWGSRDFPSKNDKVLWRPRHLWPPEGYYFFRDPYFGSI
jgi:hypothetical protein